jgi:predicted YcjX-like family ATPase
MAYKISEIKINGQRFDVLVSHEGRFQSMVNGDNVYADTFEKLKAKIQSEIKSAMSKCAVYFSRLDAYGKFEHGTATGIHSRTGNVLTSLGQCHRYSNRSIFRKLTQEEIDKYLEAVAERDRADDKVSEMEQAWRIDLRDAVQEAIRKCLKDQAEKKVHHAGAGKKAKR